MIQNNPHDFGRKLMDLGLQNSIRFDPQEKTILIVDDDPIVADMISVWLGKMGFKTRVAHDGQQALQSAAHQQPDLILLDVMMPGLDGFTTCQRLKANNATQAIPIIFLTALTEMEDKIHGFAVGGVDYLIKPAQKEELYVRILTHLNLQTLNDQLEKQIDQRTQAFSQGNRQLQEEIVERKRVEAELTRRNRELTLLNRIIATSASILEPEAMLKHACTELALTFDLPRVSAALVDEAETIATIVAEHKTPDLPVIVGTTIPLKDIPLLQRHIPQRKPMIIESIQDQAELAPFHEQLRNAKLASLALFPLATEQTLLGGLIFSIAESSNFSAEDFDLAWNVADQVAGNLARAQLHQSNQQLEAQLRHAQKMEAIGRLAGGMAHDFNNLITVITGYAELLLFRHIKKDTPEYREIEQIHKASQRASTLTRQLLAFSRQQVIQPRALDINAIINDIKEMVRRLISENIELVTVLNPVLDHILADPGQMEQIILNLVVNACDAMPQGGTLTIKTANVNLDPVFVRQHVGLAPGAYVKFSVSDTGIGMDQETQLHIFEPFFTTKAQGKGTGLGLSMVYGIVQQNEGAIAVTSQPGQGTKFDIYLPRVALSKTVVKESGMAAEIQSGTEIILLVEDEDMVRQLARYTLMENGYQVLEAHNGRAALEICQQHNGPIDLLLTDVVMPGKLSGRELAQKMQAQYPNLKVLFMSGYTDDTIVRHGVLDANLAFLQKPFSPTTLAHKVREVLDT
jgi:signal transduction histidine kinase/DNA-binding response OmpR family regulator